MNIIQKRNSMEEFIVKRIIEIHDDIIKEYGGTYGLLTQGTLELLVYKVNREKDVFKQAALILQTIAAQHPFFDGNKRTAFATAENVLRACLKNKFYNVRSKNYF